MVFILIAIIVVSVGIDALSKYLVTANIALGESVTVIPHILDFTYIRNEGAALGMLSDKRFVFLILSTVAIIGMTVVLFVRHKQLGKLYSVCFALIIGGGIGNMIDRLFGADILSPISAVENIFAGNGFDNFLGGAVVDFIDLSFYRWTFNFADACVNVGVWIFAGVFIYREVKAIIAEKKANKEAAIAEGEDKDEGEGEDKSEGEGQ